MTVEPLALGRGPNLIISKVELLGVILTGIAFLEEGVLNSSFHRTFARDGSIRGGRDAQDKPDGGFGGCFLYRRQWGQTCVLEMEVPIWLLSPVCTSGVLVSSGSSSEPKAEAGEEKSSSNERISFPLPVRASILLAGELALRTH